METPFTNYRDMTFGEMLSLTRQWTGPARATLELFPGPASVLLDLDDFLIAATAVEKSQPESQLAELDELLTLLDATFDDLAIGAYDLIGGLIRLSRDPATAKGLATLRGHLFPVGKSITLASYLTQAAAAEGVLDRLTDEDRPLTERIVLLEDASLAVVIERWRTTGIALRENVVKREALRQATAQSAGPTGGEILGLRNTWIRKAKFLREAIENARDITTAQRQELLAGLDSVQIKAAERAAKRRQAAAVATVPPPV